MRCSSSSSSSFIFRFRYNYSLNLQSRNNFLIATLWAIWMRSRAHLPWSFTLTLFQKDDEQNIRGRSKWMFKRLELNFKWAEEGRENAFYEEFRLNKFRFCSVFGKVRYFSSLRWMYVSHKRQSNVTRKRKRHRKISK